MRTTWPFLLLRSVRYICACKLGMCVNQNRQRLEKETKQTRDQIKKRNDMLVVREMMEVDVGGIGGQHGAYVGQSR